MEDCIRENVKVVEEFVDDEVTKVEIDNKEFLGSFANFIDRGIILFFMGKILSFGGSNNGYVGFYKVIVFRMFMLVLVGL